MFWLLVTGGFVVTMTMLLSMLPLFGTEELEELLEIHRYSGLVVVVAVALHLYCVLLQRLRWR
jgi:cytochrome b subunit of formate dehydrogenase